VRGDDPPRADRVNLYFNENTVPEPPTPPFSWSVKNPLRANREISGHFRNVIEYHRRPGTTRHGGQPITISGAPGTVRP